MKLIITIPAYNEGETIAGVIKEIPRDIALADSVEIIVIDDGSNDNTVREAKGAGADKIISFKQNRGLAQAFRTGLETALERCADIIVNIDADGQYNGKEIEKLIEPIVNERADVVLGERQITTLNHMPMAKKIGNKVATWVTRCVTGLPIKDAQTGFRAFSRDTALRINVVSDYTYVQETIIQAVNKGLTIVEVPVQFRERKGGESRLISNIFSYARKAGATILITYMNYKPLRTFLFIGGLIFLSGFAMGLRVLIHYLRSGFVSPYIPSAILTVVLLIIGFLVIILGLIADIVGTNRKILEEILYRLRK